ncbi:MAG TPA: GNAT family N-acetyltransferase [Pseudolysinimonas sp.]|nr:GNAT family N-acetyltransferase [Pseudolysinimonas sp.]
MTDIVTDEPQESRYVLRRDGRQIGQSVYEREPGVIRFLHTEIDPELKEHGLGSMLVKASLDDVRAGSDDRVIAQCPFVRAYIARHPEYQDLLER